MNFRFSLVTLLFLLPSLAGAYVDLPKSCYTHKTVPCSLRATEKGETFHWHQEGYSLDLVAAQKSSWTFTAEGLRLVDGSLWIQEAKDLPILHRSVGFRTQGELYLSTNFENGESRLEIRNLDGALAPLHAEGDLLALSEIPVGFQNWLGEVSSKGILNRGIVRPIEGVKFIPQWAKQMNVRSTVSEERIQSWKKKWSQSVSQGSEFYAEVVKRNMASVEARQKSIESRQKHDQEEKQMLRKLYRQKNEGL